MFVTVDQFLLPWTVWTRPFSAYFLPLYGVIFTGLSFTLLRTWNIRILQCLKCFSPFTSYSVPRLAHYASGFHHHLYVNGLQMCKAAHSGPRVPLEISGLMSEKIRWAQYVKTAFIMSPSPQTWLFSGLTWFVDPCSLTFAKSRLALQCDISLSLLRRFPQ